MGFCVDPTPEMGEYSVEVRRESFYLRDDDQSIEILIEDIPKIREALDQVEFVVDWRPT